MKWPVLDLSEVAEIVGGSTPRRDCPEYWGGTIPWVTPTDLPMPGEGIADVHGTAEMISEEGLASCSAQILPVGTVLFSSRATIGKIGIARVPLATNQGFANLIPRPFANSRFLAYALQYHTAGIAALAGSTTFREVNKGALKRFRVSLPPPSEQCRIVEILDQADALRKKRAEADAKAERTLPAIFHEAFGDPATNSRNWKVTTLGELTAEFRYGTSTKCYPAGAGLPVLRIPNIIGGEIDLADLKCAELPGDEVERLRLGLGDLLFVRTNGNREYVGRCAVFDLEEPYLFASYLIRAQLKPSEADPWYVAAFMRTPRGRQVMAPFIRTTAGQSNISIDGLTQIPVPCPPLPEQQKFRAYVERLRALGRHRHRAGAVLEQLFASLLHRAFTGDLTANWREAHKEELLTELAEQTRILKGAVSTAGTEDNARDRAADENDQERHMPKRASPDRKTSGGGRKSSHPHRAPGRGK